MDGPHVNRRDPDRVDGPMVVEYLRARDGAEITIRKLQVFWAVAHTESLTRAAKHLGATQPSLSQQLAGFETLIGFALFERRSNAMRLTEAGQALLGKAEAVLKALQAFEDDLALSADQPRQSLRVAGISSVMKLLVPAAMASMTAAGDLGCVDLDLHEAAPAEIIDLLYARRINVGLVAANSIAEVGSGFREVLVLTDRQLLVVPEALSLEGIRDPARDLSPRDRALLGRTIQFAFGTQHATRIQDWFDQVIPGNRLAARTRSFELVVEMARAGLGVGVVPALSVLGAAAGAGVRLYETDLPPRRIVAILPTQYQRQQPYARFVSALVAAGQAVALPAASSPPPFLRHRGRGRD